MAHSLYSDPYFEKMLGRMAEHLKTGGGLHDVEAGVYAYDLTECWYNELLKQTPDDIDGIPLSIDILPIGINAPTLVNRTFAQLNSAYRDIIGLAWYSLRGDLYAEYVEQFVMNDAISDNDLVMVLAHGLYLVPDSELDDARISLRMFHNFDRALQYGTA